MAIDVDERRRSLMTDQTTLTRYSPEFQADTSDISEKVFLPGNKWGVLLRTRCYHIVATKRPTM